MTKDEYIAIRDAQIVKHMEIQDLLRAAGVANFYSLVDELVCLSEERTRAFAALSHDDVMAILAENRANVARVLAAPPAP